MMSSFAGKIEDDEMTTWPLHSRCINKFPLIVHTVEPSDGYLIITIYDYVRGTTTTTATESTVEASQFRNGMADIFIVVQPKCTYNFNDSPMLTI